MGYRNYIASMPKKEYDKIKNMTKEKFYKHRKVSLKDEYNGYIGVYDVASKELYGFGKYCEFADKKFLKPVFKNKRLQRDYESDHEFYIVQKEFIKHIIEHYTEKVKSFYNELLNGVTIDSASSLPQKRAEAWFSHFRSYSSEWNQLIPYDLERGEEVTTSWKYEYAIFELVRIYKTFDWKNNVMIYYGY